jgi:DNA-binding NarL/FixJ family response regulator
MARVRLYALFRREAWAEVEPVLAEIEAGAVRLGSDAVGSPANFRAAVEALRDGGVHSVPEFPPAVHLGNLAAVLAAAEAVAYGGSQADAARWLGLWDERMPATVRSSLEWPVSSARIHGLLALRAGQPRRARRSLEAAARWAFDAKHNVEHALATLQLAELFASAEFVMPEQKRSQQRREAWTRLREAAVPPAAHAYVVGRGISQAAPCGPGSRLTPRETEVLVLLAQGLTYKAIGASLGVRWPTVQTLAHRSYEKLGVSGKMAAVAVARDNGIL